ncbi:MAG: phage tail tape measure protein [Muribaculaceae bacterium]|nr:phage tail tape measure protein [Muribaculaceae bacterium]
MARYTSNTDINLNLNAKQASKMLNTLKQQAAELEKKFKAAEAAGDKVQMRKLRQQINENARLMRLLQTETAQVAEVMNRLNSASPKELRKTLSTLQNQLNGMKRGTEEFRRQCEMIRRVRNEINSVNASLAQSQSMWQKFNGWINNCSTAIMGMAAAVSGLIAAGRNSVNRYADIEESMANSVKYTRMSREEVDQLNAAFKKMDTRLYRDELNLLAQEGGRLGYSTLESVKGYTEAAQIIKVALVDLGEGATQDIAKLTNIFGVEKYMGIKKAMLSVGSAVNELSQNCTASKPYLVEFAKRMAGIGSQAGMTIPQILAFGAVLDANGQKVEMSATAIQKVLMNLANKNFEFAKTLGINAKELNKVLKYSATDGLLMFLERLHEIGESTSYSNATMALAPAFSEMGLDAARVSQVLSTLAQHIDEIKWQLGNAKTAFDEASSATNEFNIFNNTVQASIDKAKGRVRELSIELGEKLYPVLKHIYTSSGIFLRVLNTIVSFIVNNRLSVLSLVSALIGYHMALGLATIKTKLFTAATVAQNAAMGLIKGASLLASAAFFALSGNLGRASAAMRMFNVVTKANPIGLIIGLLTSLIPVILELTKHTESYAEKADKVVKKANEVSDATISEQRELGVLVGKLMNAGKETDEYKKLKDQLISQYGRYLSGLIDEKGEIINLTQAYNTLSLAIERTNRLRNIDNSKSEILATYDKSQSSEISRLQKSLLDRGMNSTLVGQIIEDVTLSVGQDKPISDWVIDKVVEFSKNSKQGWENLPFADKFNKDLPVKILENIYNAQWDKDKSIKALDDLKLAIDPTTNIEGGAILKSYNALKEIVKGGNTDYVELPAYYIPEGTDISLFKHLEQDPDKRQKLAAADNKKNPSAPAKSDYTERLNNNIKERSGVVVDPHPGIPLSKDEQKKLMSEISPFVDGRDGREAPAKKPKDNLDRKDGQTFSYIAITPIEAADLMAKMEEDMRMRGISFDNSLKDKPADGKGSHLGSGNRFSSNHKKGISKSGNSKEKSEKELAFEWQEKLRERRKNEAIVKRANGYYMEYPKKSESDRGKRPIRYEYTKNDYDNELITIDKKYYDELLKRDDLTIDEQKEFRAKLAELRLQDYKNIAAQSEEEENIVYNHKLEQTKQKYMDEYLSTDEYNNEIIQIDKEHFSNLALIYRRQAKDIVDGNRRSKDGVAFDDWITKAEEYEKKLRDILFKEFEDKKKKDDSLWSDLSSKFTKHDPVEDFDKYIQSLIQVSMASPEKLKDLYGWISKITYDKINPENKENSAKSKIKDAKKNYTANKEIINTAMQYDDLFNSGENSKEYEIYLRRINSELRDSLIAPMKECKSEWVSLMSTMIDSWADFADALKDPEADPFNALSKGIEATAALTSAIMSQVSEFTKAQMEIQEARIEKRYAAELKFAEGNAYLTKKLEREKQKELAEMKSEEANKAFAMQVIGAVAQTASNAISAYGAALQIGPAGLVLAPIAAGLAVAQGAVQIATINKQKEAAAAKGYSEGGFTKKGAKDEPAGIVHAGEWVASQKLVNSPVARPILNALEYAQRTNRIASLSMEDVSSSVILPARRAVAQDQPQQLIISREEDKSAPDIERLSSVIARLEQRLDEPIVARSYVAGNGGSKQANDKYDRMIANKSRKSR